MTTSLRKTPVARNAAPSLRARIGGWRAVLAMLALFLLAVRPAHAQSILRDAETEALFADMMAPLATAAGMSPANVKVVLVNDPSINAFVAGGQIVYVHAGLIKAAESAGEVQGVLAHELGHVAGGHIVRAGEGAGNATSISILSMVLGVLAAAAGATDAGMGIIAAGQQAAISKYLAFSRVQESSADAAGASYLASAGLSAKGKIAFFKRLQNLEYRYAIPQDDDQAYARTHPLSGDRIAALMQTVAVDPAWDRPTDPALEARFQRVKGKLIGFVEEPRRTLVRYPVSDTSVPARLARAYAYHKSAYPDLAMGEANALIALDPADPYFLEIQGQVMLESGRARDAVAPLRRAFEVSDGNPLIATLLGHALVAIEEPATLTEAEQVLRSAVARDPQNPAAWYQLGIVYDRRGDGVRASLATAERLMMANNPAGALAHAERAVTGLAVGSSDAIRAQDIAMVARAEVERRRKKR